jgi:hemerythrin superfamily protein
MKIQNLLFVFLLVIGVSCKTKKTNEPEKNVTIITGEVDNMDETELMIVSCINLGEVIDTISVVNGKFSHEFYTNNVMAFSLVSGKEYKKWSGSSYTPFTFFSERDELIINLKSTDFPNSEIKGGYINQQYRKFYKEILAPTISKSRLIYEKYSNYEQERLHSDEGNELRLAITEALSKDKEKYLRLIKLRQELIQKGKFYSSLGSTRDSLLKANQEDYKKNRVNFIKNDNSLAGYYLLIDDLMRGKEIPGVKNIFTKYSEKFSEHQYTELGLNLVNALTMQKAGSKYVNFTAPDINGKQYEFKDILAQNEIVLLDLWATWCGPCIIKTRKVMPVYEQYKDKGFAILGVAGEHKNL